MQRAEGTARSAILIESFALGMGAWLVPLGGSALLAVLSFESGVMAADAVNAIDQWGILLLELAAGYRAASIGEAAAMPWAPALCGIAGTAGVLFGFGVLTGTSFAVDELASIATAGFLAGYGIVAYRREYGQRT